MLAARAAGVCCNDFVGIEWGSSKAASSLVKHGVSFDEAVSALQDPFSATYRDPLHSAEKDRSITIGLSHRRRLLIAAHAERGENTRIISARPVTRAEQKLYEEHSLC